MEQQVRIERFLLESPEFGALSIGKKYCTKQFISDLFALKDFHLACITGDDTISMVKCGADGTYTLKSKERYLVLSEENLKDMTVEGEQTMTRQEYITRMLELQERRKSIISFRRNLMEKYVPLHKSVYFFSEADFKEVVHENFLALILKQDINLEDILKVVKKESEHGCYSFDLFKPDFCQKLLQEVEHFEKEGLPTTRPNSMNNYGLILDDIGFLPTITLIRKKIIAPLAAILYPNNGGGDLDGHHSFIVQYSIGGDDNLGFHHDSSDVTLNLCLGKEFKGSELYFCGLLDEESTQSENIVIEHKIGRAVLHLGKHRHGAKKLVEGERTNLIVWCRASKLHQQGKN